MDKRVKQAKEMLRELEEDGHKSKGIIGGLIGGFVTILIGTALLKDISKQVKFQNKKNGQKS